MSKKFLTKEGLDNVLAAVETRYGPLLTHNHDSKYLGLTATAADSDKLDGKHLSEIVPSMFYDSNSGTGGILIATDLLSGYSHMVLVEIKGNAYAEGIPIDSVLQFYNYVAGSSIIDYRAINNGKNIGPFSVFVHDGVVKIWIPRVGPFVTYFVTVRTQLSPLYNHVTSITQAPMPTEGVSRLVTVTPSNAVRAIGTATQFIMGDGSLKPLTDITGSIDGKVSKAGDTISGQLMLSSGNDKKLILNNTDTETNYQQISFRQNNVEYGWLGTTADKALKWNGYKLLNEHNYPDFLNNTYSVKSHTHNILSAPADTRSVATKPNDYNAKLAFTGMKSSSAIGGNGESAYMNGFGWRGWGDKSGGNAWEIFGSDSSLFCRNGSTETWGEWNKFLTDKNYQGLLDTRYFHAGNMGPGSGLNADMLDGYHASSFLQSVVISSPQALDANTLTADNTIYTTTSDIGSWSTAFTNFPTAKPAGSFFLITLREGAYKKQIYSAYMDNHLYVRRSSYANGEHWGEWEKVAFTGDNVASATKLSDNGTYTAWGQTFFENGKPKKVSDSLTLFTGSPTAGGWAREVLAKDSAGNDLGGFGFLGQGNALKYAYIGNSHSAPWVAVTPAGNVGIGTNAPAYPLDVNGDGRFATGLIVGTVPSGANVPMLGIYSQRDIVSDGNVTAKNGLVDTLLVNAQGMLFKLSNAMIIDTAEGPVAGTQFIPFAKIFVKEIHLGGATFTYDESTDSVICDKTIASKAGVSCLVTDGTSTANPGTGGDISTPIG